MAAAVVSIQGCPCRAVHSTSYAAGPGALLKYSKAVIWQTASRPSVSRAANLARAPGWRAWATYAEVSAR